MASMEEFDRAQTQAMELLLQQCMNSQHDSFSVDTSSRNYPATNATILDLLAQSCADANAAVQELSVEEVASELARAVSATQKSLRSVGENVSSILQDPEQMRELCYHVKQTDTEVLEALQKSQTLLEDKNDIKRCDDEIATDQDVGTALMVSSNEENVRNMMMFAENVCTMMDHALSTITQDELALAAQLSLSIAQRLLDAGQALFTSLGDEERKKRHGGDRSDHITIEEIEEIQDGDNQSKEEASQRHYSAKHSRQLQRTAVLRTYLNDMYHRSWNEATNHPFLAGALTAAGLPFIGFAIPVASVIALALLIEKYYPEHTRLTLELCYNFLHMSKLWFLLLKIGGRQVSVIAKESFKSWYKHASEHGFVATGFELASTGCSIGYLGLSYLYQIMLGFTKDALGNNSG
ncbi:uncharacterized protein PHALS_13864 [Plasmopara halstedii]|uniref:Uncharacterized protein n=1 Tax=Plasmopara halstedii TaxID=4781 RepID=A0A0P1A3R8_PLAHL|nr:uncharacterized protein PHALS_13864 [Plasmopara halstedii]CEG35101.1 hypothetical protein PHALS_13864 [Plasmopara halstedii]|eukprot:XP_024571470.1 hypothetical protein PHALS_13864 [Plasmopara halstedii]